MKLNFTHMLLRQLIFLRIILYAIIIAILHCLCPNCIGTFWVLILFWVFLLTFGIKVFFLNFVTLCLVIIASSTIESVYF